MSCKYYTQITINDRYYLEITISDNYYVNITLNYNYYVEIKTCEDVLKGIGTWIIEDTFIIQ